jgi:rhodanese-related sulfurtransferase
VVPGGTTALSLRTATTALSLRTAARLVARTARTSPARPALALATMASSAKLASASARKPGVAAPHEIADFVARAGSHLVVVDARGGDAVEPSAAGAPMPPTPDRPRAISAPLNRATNSLDLQAIPQAWIDAAGGREKLFVITHCGGGGRGQKAKEFLLKHGFKNVINGGGPEDKPCWTEFANK